jgi:Flavin containing amine oxidoreductase
MKVHYLAWVAVAAVATAVVHGLSSPSSSSAHQQERPTILRVAVIGGGWAGFAAAESLAGHCGTTAAAGGGAVTVQVTLLDASPRGPGGLAGAGWTTPKLRQPLEAGLHGFWRGYRNTFAILERIGISTAGADNDDIDDDGSSILTPYLPSALVSATGPVAVAPVLGTASSTTTTKRSGNAGWLESIAARLPPPLDIALLTDYDDQSPITLLDRISALGLLGAWLDFNPEDASSWDRYDQISAEQLFRDVARVSPTLYTELIVPLLHVLPMTTGYDCSAAAALSCFHAFALHAKGAFDVRWCKGSIADLIFRPWSDRLVAKGVLIRGSCRLTNLQEEELSDPATTASSTRSTKRFVLTVNDNEQMVFDAVILAIGSTAAKRLAPVCTPLLSTLHYREWKTGITCVAVRLFLDRTKVPAAFLTALQSRPAVTVCGPRIILPQLIETGFCVYDLTRLQRGSSGANHNDEWLVLEVDFFRANAVAKLADDAIVDLALAAIETMIVGSSRRRRPTPQQMLLRTESVLDVGIVRAKDAVSHFSMGAARSSPPVRIGRGVYMCGDWIDRRGHASWSTEKAVVTGIDAATQLAADFALSTADMPSIIPSSNDTSRDLIAMRETVSFIRKSVPSDIQKRIVAF